MTSRVMSEWAEEMAERADPTPAVTAATRSMRRARAEQLDEVHAVLHGGAFYAGGFRSPTDWLLVTTRESVGQCKVTIILAERIQAMPLVKRAFTAGDLAESSLRLLAAAWAPAVADVFQRDEQMLCHWATTLANRDLKMVLDTWRMHADPERESRTAHEQFDVRAVHLSGLLDGLGRLDGTLDPEGFALLREAIRCYAQPADGETRSAAMRRADALVTIARLALEQYEPQPGRKRRKPKVVATIAYDDLISTWWQQQTPDTDITDPDAPTCAPGTERESGGGGSGPQRSAPGSGGSIDTDLDRIVVPAEAIRRLACDCNVHRYIANPLGTVVDFGRSQRVVSDSLFDTLLIRDHGCRWAGCGVPAGGCDAHHAIHWLDHGATEPDNLVLLCWFHHHLLHEQHWSIEPLGGGHFTLSDPSGATQILRPPLVGLALPQLSFGPGEHRCP